MIRREDAAVIVRASAMAASYGHQAHEDRERRGSLWATTCKDCGRRVIVSPEQGRIFGPAVRARCESTANVRSK